MFLDPFSVPPRTSTIPPGNISVRRGLTMQFHYQYLCKCVNLTLSPRTPSTPSKASPTGPTVRQIKALKRMARKTAANIKYSLNPDSDTYRKARKGSKKKVLPEWDAAEQDGAASSEPAAKAVGAGVLVAMILRALN